MYINDKDQKIKICIMNEYASIKQLLKNYEINKLLRTAEPKMYNISASLLIDYKTTLEKSKHFNVDFCYVTPNELGLSDEYITKLNDIIKSRNADKISNEDLINIDILFGTIMFWCTHPDSINSKDIDRALEIYYDLFQNNREAFGGLLSAFADSPYYSDDRGLNLNDVSRFMVSPKGQKFINKYYY